MVVFDDGSGQVRPLPHFMRHSPGGFEWGYGGSGPADLALAILADATGDLRYALAQYQQFKREMVTRMAREGWVLHRQEVQDWIRTHPTAEQELAALVTEARGLRQRCRAVSVDTATRLGQPSAVCHRCRRLLTNARSRARGYGEQCWRLVKAEDAGTSDRQRHIEIEVA